ncbi:protein of unknown function [Paraburkholderia dioscoreae]|uniref:3-hydroxyisobutyrate dehydrogenase-like NAD-binding domain-containing protein n=1 Tax=Paraburkholderia dioscoreae TaxID=2604047 RepID=A0A5Q4ZDT7_9BURK|nr:protein of unknown function [Paraburkholderia dioscoreae]
MFDGARPSATDKPVNSSQEGSMAFREHYDYVIVGAGSAGCVLANLLSADSGVSVPLLESGPPDRSALIHMPRGIGKILNPGGSLVWSYRAAQRSGRDSEDWSARDAMGRKRIRALADRGYFNATEIKACDDAGIGALLPKTQTSGAKADGRFDRADFIYIARDDQYLCPAGQRAIYRYTSFESVNLLELRTYWSSACPKCPMKSQCTPADYRRIRRWEHEAVLEVMQSLPGSRPYQTYSGNIIRSEYRPGFKASLGLTDLHLASEAAEQAGRTLPMLAAVHGQMAEPVEAGMGSLDWSAIAALRVVPSK